MGLLRRATQKARLVMGAQRCAWDKAAFKGSKLAQLGQMEYSQ